MIGLAAALGVPPSGAIQVAWTLEEPDCVNGGTVIEIQCGAYGVFHVGEALQVLEAVAAPCTPTASGEEEPLVYPPPPELDGFPFPSRHLRPIGGDAPSPLEAAQARVRGRLAARVAPAPSPPPTPPPVAPPPSIVVVDFSGGHGDSTTWLVGEVAGAGVDTVLASLDDPALAALGEDVGDFHVLARLCEIAEMVDHEGAAAPVAVNMSFGRAPAPTDPSSATTCDPSRVSCQIARVLAHLRTRHMVFVAASGNHRELLFPASLPDVVGVGMLDVDRFLRDGVVRAAWETPEGAEGLFPGNAICLQNWAIPAGSSYSSALLTGWLVPTLLANPSIDPTGDVPWVPQLDAGQDCFVLARGDEVTTLCNAAVRRIFEGLAGGNAETCWGIATTPSETVELVARAEDEPPFPSFDRFAVGEHPTPESDPCVPCVGRSIDQSSQGSESFSASSLSLDLSQSVALPVGTHLDAVSLRVGASYFPLALSPPQLEALESGGLAQLVLSGAVALLGVDPQASLWYRLKADEAVTCDQPDACYWSSTPILLPP